jgi:biotin synthase
VEELRSAGVDRLGIALDGASEQVFTSIKGKGVGNPYDFEDTWKALERASRTFGPGKVSTHLIVGMGETDRDLFVSMKRAAEIGVSVSLFSFTPMAGISFKGSRPDIGRYRSIQLLRNSIFVSMKDLSPVFDEDGKLRSLDLDQLSMDDMVHSVMTSGCPDCNRPYYNERPGGKMYNYPYLPDRSIYQEIREDISSYLDG